LPSISTTPKAKLPVLPCPAHAVANDADRRIDAAGTPRSEAAIPAGQDGEGDAYQADRAFHAMLARATGGISPAALLLA
jgi:polyhydroxyalkanoate synthase subunit PhaC